MFFLNEKTSHNKNNDIQGSHNKIKITDVQKKNHNVLGKSTKVKAIIALYNKRTRISV